MNFRRPRTRKRSTLMEISVVALKGEFKANELVVQAFFLCLLCSSACLWPKSPAAIIPVRIKCGRSFRAALRGRTIGRRRGRNETSVICRSYRQTVLCSVEHKRERFVAFSQHRRSVDRSVHFFRQIFVPCRRDKSRRLKAVGNRNAMRVVA